MVRQRWRRSLLLFSILSLIFTLGACGRTPPSNTTDPTNPTDPTDPTDSTDPSDSTDPTTPTTLQPLEISGTVAGWAGGEAVIRAEASNGDASFEYVTIAEGELHADGSFSLTLPVEEATFGEALITGDTNLFCPKPGVSTIEISPEPPRLALSGPFFGVYASSDSDERIGDISVDYATSDGYSYLFASIDATIRGDCVTASVDGYSTTLTLDLDLGAGWNAVFTTAEAESTVTSASTGSFEELSWIYTEEISPVDPSDPSLPPDPADPSDPTDVTDPTTPVDPTTPDPRPDSRGF